MKVRKILVSENVVLPAAFKAAGMHAGVKKPPVKDLALIVSDRPAVVAGMFTTNQVKAAPVKWCMKQVQRCKGRAVVINSGNANACTGPGGDHDTRRMAEVTACMIGFPVRDIYVCSTGVIGRRLPLRNIEQGIRKLAPKLSTKGIRQAAEAILTTDTKPKCVTARLRVDGKPVIISAIAKGAGMIEPNMATMLCFVMTDAAVDPRALQQCLRSAVTESFNRITVDGDRSTNDTVLFFANGAAGNRQLRAGHPAWPSFCNAVGALTMDLAMKMVRDGEGATKVVEVHVKGARNDGEADAAARAVANSFLVKTSWHGDNPNWGRIMDSLGYSAAKVVEQRVDISYNHLSAVKKGVSSGASLAALKQIQRSKQFRISIDLHLGKGESVIYTCDCSEEYVTINV